MTMDGLYNSVESAINQYEQCKRQEEELIELIRVAENEMNHAVSQASSEEDSSAQKQNLERARSIGHQIQSYKQQLQQLTAQKMQAQQYLVSTKSELQKVAAAIQEKLPKIVQSIKTFEAMAANPLGASAAAQLPKVRQTYEDYKENYRKASNLIDRIDSVLEGGSSPQKTLKLR